MVSIQTCIIDLLRIREVYRATLTKYTKPTQDPAFFKVLQSPIQISSMSTTETTRSGQCHTKQVGTHYGIYQIHLIV
jgi:hypothetical protein